MLDETRDFVITQKNKNKKPSLEDDTKAFFISIFGAALWLCTVCGKKKYPQKLFAIF